MRVLTISSVEVREQRHYNGRSSARAVMISGCPVDREIVWCLLYRQPMMLVLLITAFVSICVLWRSWTNP